MSPLPMPKIQTEYFALGGGLNLTTPHLRIPSGMVVDAVNYEPAVNGGYKRMVGFERYDGRTSPSAGVYHTMTATISASIAQYATVTGATSGATAKVLVAATTATTTLVLTAMSGTFVAGENIQVSAVDVGVVTAASVQGGEDDPETDAQHTNRAADYYRSLIQTVTGSGRIRGVWVLKGVTYAFRDNAGGTACVMYKATASGWSAITFKNELSFTAGSVAPTEGGTVTKGAVSATVRRVVLQSGTWGAGTAAGRLIIDDPSGGNFSAGAFTAGITATCSGAQTAITLAAGGRFEFVNYNFSGSTDTLRMYGCDGVNRAFEFDQTGDVFVPITTGMTTDTPNYIAAHRNHLFLAFRGSLQHCSIGFPYQWSVVTGASELGLGADITGLLPQVGNADVGAMAVWTADSTFILYGTSSANWKLVQLSDEFGAYARTVQNVGNGAHCLDNMGVVQLGTTQNFGNFAQASKSRLVQPIIDELKSTATASSTLPSRNLYRLYFSDGTGLTMGIDGNKLTGFMPFDLGKTVYAICNGKDSSGEEVVFFGSDDGYVYQAERGTSWDGDAITYWLRMPFNHSKSPRFLKRYYKAVFEMEPGGFADLSLQPEFDYGDSDRADHRVETYEIGAVGGYWGQDDWGSFFWDGRSVDVPEVTIDGNGASVSISVYGSSDYEPSHTMQGVILHYALQRLMR